MFLGVDLARCDLVGMFCIEPIRIGVEGHHKLVIGDDLRGCENPGSADDRLIHGAPLP